MTSKDDDDDLFDLDALRAAMKGATPAPDPAKRDADLRLAQENFAVLQGSRPDARLTSDREPRGLLRGMRQMLNTLTGRTGLGLTTALVACGIFILSPMGEDLMQRAPGLGPQEPAPGPVSQPDQMPEPMADSLPAPEAEMQAAPRAEETLPLSGPDDRLRTGPADGTVVLGEMAEMAEEAPAFVESGDLNAPAPLQRLAAPTPSAGIAPGGEAGYIAAEPPLVLPGPDTETFANAEDNPLRIAAEEPVSTFSIDVDTASWSVIRSSILGGYLPPAEAVRIEEMINYFPYDYAAPEPGEAPFRPTISVFETPWNEGTELVHIALQGEMPALADRPPLNLVFLIDTSGSMADADKLPLLKQSFRLMLAELRPEDEVAIVEYAGSAGVALPPTAAGERSTVLAALDGLGAGGSTNGQGGLEQAYALAAEMAEDGEVSRVLLATDGDFNVGLSDPSALEDYIADKRETGIYLSVLGFGRGNLDDATMQALAQNGNGQAAYIDTLSEARKVLVDQLTGALFPIAGDVKVQVEWNPAEVAEYRLIGYETRALAREDFANDRVDAGELGAGHSVTAIYEVTPVGSPARLTEDLRYAADSPQADAAHDGELGFLRLRWKEPGEDVSQLMETPIALPEGAARPGTEAAFAAAIAGFGQLLKDSPYLGSWGYDEAIALATESRGDDPFGYRNEALQLMRLAQSLAD
ncbi:von Willebrand factor type A domain-containing protein [Pseudoroseicyclus sp. CXY001]|uniref:vWA domain-containing protein n=1 Tax=Pseudoroseicyclus sp. CXY001 TaxID=3242492 RepID=UPI0035710093